MLVMGVVQNTVDFKKKFGITIRSKTRKLIDLPEDLINNEDYKLFSNDPDRKKE